jgi:hypothetical protein
MILFVFSVSVAAQSAWNRLDVRGLPAPYNFYRYQALSSGESIGVAAEGDFQYYYADKRPSRKEKVSTDDLNAVYFTDPSHGWVVGSTGAILLTRNEGRSWTRQTSGTTADLMAIDCIDRKRCWAVGDKGTIVYTKDGKTWKQANAGTSVTLNAVDFLDALNGLVVGDKAVLLRTRDGGISWTQEEITGGEETCNGRTFASDGSHLYSVKYFSAERIWAVGLYGVAKYTGESRKWAGMCTKSDPFIGIVTQDGVNLFAVGSDSHNQFSTDSGRTWKDFDPEKWPAN